MITDGVDYYNPRYDPEDPYMQAAITDSVRSGLVVYSMYWQNQGRFDRTGYATNAGQNLLQQVTQATGGISYWQGYGNPVPFQPYFKDLDRRLANQYEVGFTAPLKGKPVGGEHEAEGQRHLRQDRCPAAGALAARRQCKTSSFAYTWHWHARRLPGGRRAFCLGRLPPFATFAGLGAGHTRLTACGGYSQRLEHEDTSVSNV